MFGLKIYIALIDRARKTFLNLLEVESNTMAAETDQKYDQNHTYEIKIEEGTFFLENFLSQEEQLTIYEECCKLYKNEANMFETNGSIEQILSKKHHKGRYLLSFLCDFNIIPKFYNQFAKSIFTKLDNYIENKFKNSKDIYESLPRVLPSNEWISDRLNCVLYPLNSKLGRHCDNVDGWVILFSLGCSVEFYIQVCSNENNKGTVYTMKSGDIIIFEAGNDARVLHGVDKVIPQTCPKFLQKYLQNGRIGLQLRQYVEKSK